MKHWRKSAGTITSERYLKEILHLIVTMTAEMMDSKICSIMLLDEKKQELAIEVSQSLSQEYLKKSPLRLNESVSGKALKENKPVAILDVTREPAYGYPELAKKEGLVSMLAVPMMIKDRGIGVINSYTSLFFIIMGSRQALDPAPLFWQVQGIHRPALLVSIQYGNGFVLLQRLSANAFI